MIGTFCRSKCRHVAHFNVKFWFDFLREIIVTSYEEFTNASEELWSNLFSGLTTYMTADFWKAVFVLLVQPQGIAAATAFIIFEPIFKFLEHVQTFTARLRALPVRILVRAAGKLLPVPQALNSKVMTLKDCVRLITVFTVEYSLVAITSPPPWWVALGRSVRSKYKWIRILEGITIGKAIGAAWGIVIDFIFLLISITVGIGAGIIILLMLWSLAETLGSEEKTAALFNAALPQDSKKITLKTVAPVLRLEKRINIRKGPETDEAPKPKFL